VRARIAATVEREPRRVGAGPRRRHLAVGIALTATATAAAVLTIVSPGVGPAGVESATAAVQAAAAATALPAERSGTAVVRITRDGKLWAGSTLRWNGGDLAVSQAAPTRARRPGSGLLLVDEMLYGMDEGGWVALGSPDGIDPGSGTTPAEYLAALRRDVGGGTLRTITGGMTGLTTRPLDDGSTVYEGTVAAGLIASEAGMKGGRPIRVLPFGYLAHGEAADPSSLLDVAVIVGPDELVRTIAATWAEGASTWKYAVAYSDLGTTAAPTAPADARPLEDRMRADRS
jgi:hypothetical protein